MKLPNVSQTRRARKDVRELLAFIGMQPWGKPKDRQQDLQAAYLRIQQAPFAKPVRRWVEETGVGLRCVYVAQFAIIYAWLGKDEDLSSGEVSIRAVRHRRERDVFFGVKDGGAVSHSQLRTHQPQPMNAMVEGRENMDSGNTSLDADSAEEIDVERYKTDREYRVKVHEDLDIADDDNLLDLEERPDEEPAFDSSRYATDEEADAAFDKYMDDILEEVLREAAENRSHAQGR